MNFDFSQAEKDFDRLRLKYSECVKGCTPGVLTGNALISTLTSLPSETRDAVTEIVDYLHTEDYPVKVCALYGLRRTGKTTAMLQAILAHGNVEKCAYIHCTGTTSTSSLFNDLCILREAGIQYVFIDEITSVDGILDEGSMLSDIFASKEFHLVISGSYSLSIRLAEAGVLLDRLVLINTTNILYDEYKRLFPNATLDSFLRHGSILSPDYFDHPENIRSYMSSAYADNIEHSIKACDLPCSLYPALANYLWMPNSGKSLVHYAINKYVTSHVLEMYRKQFRSADLSNALNNNMYKEELSKVVKVSINEALRKHFDIETPSKELNEAVINDLNKCLRDIGVFGDIDTVIDGERFTKACLLFTSPRYQLLRVVIDELIAQGIDDTVATKTLENTMFGLLTEDYILYHCARKGYTVFHLDDNLAKHSYDMVEVTVDGLVAYEIKHSSQTPIDALKHLTNFEWQLQVEKQFGKPIIDKCCLYNGPSKIEAGINFRNIEQFLLSI